MNGKLGEFLKDYWWKLLGLVIAGTVAWTTLNVRVSALEGKTEKLDKETREHHEFMIRQDTLNQSQERLNRRLERFLERR